MMIVSIPFVYFLIPVSNLVNSRCRHPSTAVANTRSLKETKGIPLESMDRLFDVRPVRNAHAVIHAEDEAREAEFRLDAEGAGLSVAKEKLEHYEYTTEV